MSQAIGVDFERDELIRIVILLVVGSVVYQRPRLPMSALGVSSTNEPEITGS